MDTALVVLDSQALGFCSEIVDLGVALQSQGRETFLPVHMVLLCTFRDQSLVLMMERGRLCTDLDHHRICGCCCLEV